MRVIDAKALEKRRQKTVKARRRQDRHPYFHGVAEARYLLRKVFRLVEEEAGRAGIDPLAHQGLIQIYGSPQGMLRVKDVAERLDITPAFASNLVKSLAQKRYVERAADSGDNRVSWIKIAKRGRELLHRIDERVQAKVDRFTATLGEGQTEAALSILLFYAGASFRRSTR